jgi:hypothetical protein
MSAVLALCLAGAGCADNNAATTQPDDAKARQDQALKDPMNYGPNDPDTVSGNNGNNLDKKAMQKDVNDFWNP